MSKDFRIRGILYIAVLCGLGWVALSCSGSDNLSAGSECSVTPLGDGGVQVECPDTDPVTIDSGDACVGATGFSIQGVEGIEDEVVVAEPNEFVVLSDAAGALDLSFAGVGTFTVIDAEARRVRAIFDNAGPHTFAVIATDGCSVEVFSVRVNAVPCYQSDCDGSCLSDSHFDSLYQNMQCDERLNCAELSFDGGDCSCASQGLQADCWGRCVRDSELALVGNGTCDARFACEPYAFDGGDCASDQGGFHVGDFRISLEPGPDGTDAINIWHVSEPDHSVWSAPSVVGFLSGAPSELYVEEHRGSFKMLEAVGPRCSSTAMNVIDGDGETARFHIAMEGPIDACSRGASIAFEQPSPGHLRFVVTSFGREFNHLELTYDSPANERFFGFGEQFSNLNHSGQTVPILSQEQGIGRGRPIVTDLMNTLSEGSGGGPYTTYCAMPQYVSNQNRSVMLENTEYSVFDLSDLERVTIRVFDTDMTGRIFYGQSYFELVERFTDYAGRMPALPDWFHSGAVIGMQGGLTRVYEVWDSLAALGTPMSSFWLQDWVGKRATSIGSQLWWNWELDTASYPAEAWAMMVEEMGAVGIRALGYINPFLVDAADKGDATRNLFAEAAAMGYVVKNQAGEAYEVEVTDFPTFLVDLTNPDARAWLKEVIRTEMLAVGLKGWMADFSEGLPFDALLDSGIDAATYHNQYMVDWVKLNREVIEEEGLLGEVVFFNRAGFTQTPKYTTSFWAGDQAVTWDGYDGFQSSLKALMGGGFSGISINHSDIGGYTSISLAEIGITRERNLLERWTEANAFTAIYRTHEGNQPEANAQFYDDDASLAHFARFAKVYAALAPYRTELFAAAESSGAPVVRHPIMEFPDDQYWITMSDDVLQFMLGSDFMVAPVLAKNQDERSVYLPKGVWVHLWSGEVVGSIDTATTITQSAPVGSPPVYYKQGSAAGQALVAALTAEGLL